MFVIYAEPVIHRCKLHQNILYHFIQLVIVVTHDQLDEILDSSFGSHGHDIPNILSKFWVEEHTYTEEKC